jgi:uncharacterized protein YbaA (DUF1428 family)
MKYVDGFVVAVPKRKMKSYVRMAQLGAKIWREHGALEYRECAIEDAAVKFGVPFPQMMNVKRGETVVISAIVFRSRAHRDRVNAKVMKDPRIASLCDEKTMPFDASRMVYGGFEVLVDA